MKEMGLWDGALSFDQAYLRYQKFSKLTFPLVPRSSWPRYFRDLLQFEPALVFGDAIGSCRGHEF